MVVVATRPTASASAAAPRRSVDRVVMNGLLPIVNWVALLGSYVHRTTGSACPAVGVLTAALFACEQETWSGHEPAGLTVRRSWPTPHPSFSARPGAAKQSRWS